MKYQSSAIAATSMSGKSGGTVATVTNQFRRKSNPRQPNTPGQQASKNILAVLASTWASLETADQDSWNIAATNSSLMKNGERKKLTGLDMFIRTNKVLITSGQEILQAWQAPGNLPLQPGPTRIVGVFIETENGNIASWYKTDFFWRIPLDPWQQAYLWTGWTKKSRRYTGPANKIIRTDFPITTGYEAGITFGIDNTTAPAAPMEGARAQLIERYINKNTGQIFIAGTYDLRAEFYDHRFMPIPTDIQSSTQDTTVVGDNIFFKVLMVNNNNNFNFAVWEPYILFSGWWEEPEQQIGPYEIQIPNTAVEPINTNLCWVNFGPDPGMGPEPPAIGYHGHMGFMLKNTSSGEIIGQGVSLLQVPNP